MLVRVKQSLELGKNLDPVLVANYQDDYERANSSSSFGFIETICS